MSRVDQESFATTTEAEPEVIPTPPLLYWTFFIPTFAVVVFGMQRLVAPRATVADVLAARAKPEDPES